MRRKIMINAAVFLSGVALMAEPTSTIELRDGQFEESTPNGSFPSSGAWQRSWLGEAGAVCTTTAGRSGNGLWAYTGPNSSDQWSATYQEFTCPPGTVLRAEGWVRTPPGEEWVKGSKAEFQVRFLDGNGNELATVASEPLSTPSTDWQRRVLVTCPAPIGTVRVRYVCYLEKPSGEVGHSVANFDDCSLRLQEEPHFQTVKSP